MPQKCKICSHPERQIIDSLIVQRVPASQIIARYKTPTLSFSDGAVSRHRKHVDTRLAESYARHMKEQEYSFSDNLVEQLKTLQATTLLILKSAVETNDMKNCAAFIRLAQENIEKQSRVANLIPTSTNVTLNFYASPEWGVFWTVINRHHDVKLELIEELSKIPSEKQEFPVPSNILETAKLS